MNDYRFHYPQRVWFQTSQGWASREATKEDHKRRKELDEEMFENITVKREATRNAHFEK